MALPCCLTAPCLLTLSPVHTENNSHRHLLGPKHSPCPALKGMSQHTQLLSLKLRRSALPSLGSSCPISTLLSHSWHPSRLQELPLASLFQPSSLACLFSQALLDPCPPTHPPQQHHPHLHLPYHLLGQQHMAHPICQPFTSRRLQPGILQRPVTPVTTTLSPCMRTQMPELTTLRLHSSIV